MATHHLPLLPKYQRMIANGVKRREFRLLGRRSATVAAGDELILGDVRCVIIEIAQYSSINAIPEAEADGSGFGSLADLQAALRKIYWYPGAHARPILVFGLQVLSPQSAAPLPLPTP